MLKYEMMMRTREDKELYMTFLILGLISLVCLNPLIYPRVKIGSTSLGRRSDSEMFSMNRHKLLSLSAGTNSVYS